MSNDCTSLYVPSSFFTYLMDDLNTQNLQMREMFLQGATSIENWNARAVFLELLHIPTEDDIKVFCQGIFVERWKLRPHYGGFYWQCEGKLQFACRLKRDSNHSCTYLATGRTGEVYIHFSKLKMLTVFSQTTLLCIQKQKFVMHISSRSKDLPNECPLSEGKVETRSW
jgi:hypothetical protein